MEKDPENYVWSLRHLTGLPDCGTGSLPELQRDGRLNFCGIEDSAPPRPSPGVGGSWTIAGLGILMNHIRV